MEQNQREKFDPVRTFLMMQPDRRGKLITGIAMSACLFLYLMTVMGFAATPVVAVVAVLCFVGMVYAAYASLKKESMIIYLTSGLFLALGIIAHLTLLSVQSGRFARQLSPMLESMWNYDLLTAMAWEDGSWSGGYLLIMGLISRLEVFPTLYAIKLVNLVFIAASAVAVQRLYLLTGERKPLGSVLVMGISVLAMTVLLNNGAWAHCDAIFAAFSLWGLYFLLSAHPLAGCIFWGLAVGFKLQAAFLFPLLIPLFMERKVSIRHLLVGFAAFIALHIPMLLDGQSLLSILARYNEQILTVAYEGAGLTDNVPNIFGLMNIASVREFSGMGLFFGLFVALILAVAMVRRGPLETRTWLRCAILLAFGLPMILPQMNVRVFYLAFLLALADAKDIRGIAVAAVIETVSLMGYMAGLFGATVIPLIPLSIVTFIFTLYLIISVFSGKNEAVNGQP